MNIYRDDDKDQMDFWPNEGKTQFWGWVWGISAISALLFVTFYFLF